MYIYLFIYLFIFRAGKTRVLRSSTQTLATRESSDIKRKAGIFYFLRFEDFFPRAPFSRRISVDGRPNRER